MGGEVPQLDLIKSEGHSYYTRAGKASFFRQPRSKQKTPLGAGLLSTVVLTSG